MLLELEENGRASAAAGQAIARAWSRPESAARLLRAVGAVRADRYAAQVQAHLKDARPHVRQAAAGARPSPRPRPARRARQGPPIAGLAFERVLAGVQREKGDPELGGLAVPETGVHLVPYGLEDRAAQGAVPGRHRQPLQPRRAGRVDPQAERRIAQGFETQKFATTAGQVVEGFVVRESGDEVELRNAQRQPSP